MFAHAFWSDFSQFSQQSNGYKQHNARVLGLLVITKATLIA